jgi:hypothetical protein
MLDEDEEAILVGYMRKSNVKHAIKVSINKSAFEDCEIYTTSDGQKYVSLMVSIITLEKVLNGERAVTTISQIIKKGDE